MKTRKLVPRIKQELIRRQSLWSLGSNGISALAGLILFAISSSRLSAADFGIWVIFQTASTLLDMFRTGLLFPGYLQLAAGKSRKLKSTIFSSVYALFVLITLGQALVAGLLQWVVPSPSGWSFFFQNYPLIILSSAAITLAEWWFQSSLRFQYILFLRILNRLSMIGIALYFVHDLSDLIYVQAGVNVAFSIFILLFSKVPGFSGLDASSSYGLRIFNFGKYATPSQLISNLLRSSDTLMISYAMGSAATGIYGAAAKFLEFIELPIRSFGAVHFAQLAKLANAQKHQEAFDFAKQQIRITTVKVIPMALLLGIFAPQIILHISGENYLASVPVLRIMAIYCILIPADRYCGLLLEAFGKPDLNLIKVSVMCISNIVGNVAAIVLFNTPTSIAASSIITFSIGVGFGFWLILTKATPSKASSFRFNLAVEKN